MKTQLGLLLLMLLIAVGCGESERTATGAPAKAQAEDVLRARFREQALQQIAQGQDPMKETTADVDFARANMEQLKAIAAGDIAIIEEQKNMIAAGTFTRKQINARIDQMIENRVKQLEEETDRLVIAENAAGGHTHCKN